MESPAQDEGGFGGAVERSSVGSVFSPDGAQVDDDAVAAGAHHWREYADEQDGCADVGGVDLVDVCGAEACGGSEREDSSVVDEELNSRPRKASIGQPQRNGWICS